jgi:hypothetical protein
MAQKRLKNAKMKPAPFAFLGLTLWLTLAIAATLRPPHDDLLANRWHHLITNSTP